MSTLDCELIIVSEPELQVNFPQAGHTRLGLDYREETSYC